jgi:molybdopterin synthase catalytic subunit
MFMEIQLEFTDRPIVVPPAAVLNLEIGAEVEFRGIVRETEHGRSIGGLHYEAHIPMARLHLTRILAKLRETWPCQSVCFIHRLGWVPVGEASLYIRIHSSHREPAFRFCMDLIDLLKKDVPIWKLTAPSERPTEPAAEGARLSS